MQTALYVAAVIAVITGLVHSVLGEYLIFRHVRRGGIAPTTDAPPLRNRNLRILWATWHLATVFGFAFAGLLLQLAAAPGSPASVALGAAALAYAGGALLVLIGTRGRHPGWIALGAVAALIWSAIP